MNVELKGPDSVHEFLYWWGGVLVGGGEVELVSEDGFGVEEVFSLAGNAGVYFEDFGTDHFGGDEPG